MGDLASLVAEARAVSRRRPMVNVVPTARTRRIARAMVQEAAKSTGPDAVVLLMDKVEPDQFHALLAVVLNSTRMTTKPGRPRMPNQLSEADMRRGYSQYRQGVRNDFTREAYRQYQRTSQQRRRDQHADPERA